MSEYKHQTQQKVTDKSLEGDRNWQKVTDLSPLRTTQESPFPKAHQRSLLSDPLSDAHVLSPVSSSSPPLLNLSVSTLPIPESSYGGKNKNLSLNILVFDGNTAQTTLSTCEATNVKPLNHHTLFSPNLDHNSYYPHLPCLQFLLLPSEKLPEILILSHILPWSYSSLIMLHLDDWNFCLKYSKNSPAHLSTRGLECFGRNPRIFQEMDDIIPLSVSCAALPIVRSSQLSADLLSCPPTWLQHEQTQEVTTAWIKFCYFQVFSWRHQHVPL